MNQPPPEGDPVSLAIREAQAGDSAAFGQVFKAHYTQVYLTVWGMMGNEADAHDVSQQAWIKAWQKINQYNHHSKFSTWIHRIAVNTALDELRRRKRRWSRLVSIFKDDSIENPAPEPATTDDPADDLGRKEIAQDIYQAVAKLPESQRTTFVLKEFEDYTYQQIADTLGCKIGTVMSRLHLARQKLTTYLNSPKP